MGKDARKLALGRLWVEISFLDGTGRIDKGKEIENRKSNTAQAVLAYLAALSSYFTVTFGWAKNALEM